MKQNIFGVWLIYFGFIASSFSAIFSIFFFVIGLVSIFISLINTSKLSSLFLIITLIALYKLISYFLLVDKNFTLSIDYINNEGRFIFALVLLIAFTLIRLDKDSIYKVSFGCRNIFLLWLPILFFDSFLFEVFNISHHQKGAIIISGLFWQTIYEHFSDKKFNFYISRSILIFCFIGVVLSSSRVSMLGLIIVVFFPLFYKYLFRSVFSAAFLVIVFLYAFDGKIQINERQFDVSIVSSIPQAISYGAAYAERFSNADDFFSDSNIQTSDFNVAARFAMYAKSWVEFSTSPIFGIGVGRFDDISSRCSNKTSFICFHDQGRSNYQGITAHNLFLHTMVEEGLIGLSLLTLFLLKIIVSIRRLYSSLGISIYFKNIIAFWLYFLFASMFNHTFVSPIFIIGLIMPMILLGQMKIRPHKKV